MVLLTLVLTASLFLGCSSNANNGSANGSADDNARGDAKSSEEQVTIKFHADGISFKNEDLAPIIAKFEGLNPNIKVEFIPLNEASAADNVKKIDLLSASGEQLDAILLPDDRSYSQRAANGMLEPLDTFMKAEGLSYDEEYKISTEIDGSYYGLPGTFRQWFVIMNKDHLDAANLPVPTDWTWDEYLDYAKQLTQGEGASKRYGTYFHTWIDFFVLGLWNQPTDNDLVLADGTVNMDHPGVRKSMEIRHQAESVDQSATPYADIISQKLSYRPLYFNGQASMMPMGSWMIGEVGGTEEFPASFKTAFAPMPKNNEGDEDGYTYMNANYVGVVSTSKHKEEAYKFLRFFTTEGIPMMKKYLSSWKKEDTAASLEALISASKTPEMVDNESLLYTLNNSRAINRTIPLPYIGEVNNAYLAEFELLLLGDQDIDETLANAKEKIQAIVDANK